MKQFYDITPPPELLDQWCMENNWRDIAIQAARWGADMQFEACGKAIKQAWEMDHVKSVDDLLREFRAACRPNPPSLKEQALHELNNVYNKDKIDDCTYDTILAAPWRPSMTNQHPITPPPPHLLKKFSAQAQNEANKRNGTGYLKTVATLCIEWFVNSQSTSNDRQIRSSEIQPPPELLPQLEAAWLKGNVNVGDLLTAAYRAGADQELEACCAEMNDWGNIHNSCGLNLSSFLRAARRPKSPSRKEQALEAVSRLCASVIHDDLKNDAAIVRRALEALDD